MSRTLQIKDLLRVHRNELQFELEPTQVISALSKSKAIQKGSLQCASSSCTEKINDILSMVKDGSSDLVESFVEALKDLGYRDIVELIDPTDVHTKAGKYCFNRLLKLSSCTGIRLRMSQKQFLHVSQQLSINIFLVGAF